MRIFKIQSGNTPYYIFGKLTLRRYRSDGFFTDENVCEEVTLDRVPRDAISKHLLDDLLYLPEHNATEREMNCLRNYAKELFFQNESLQDKRDE